MQQVTLTVNLDQFNLIQAAINAYVVFNQQNAAILNANLQSQVQAQIQAVPVTTAPAA